MIKTLTRGISDNGSDEINECDCLFVLNRCECVIKTVGVLMGVIICCAFGFVRVVSHALKNFRRKYVKD